MYRASCPVCGNLAIVKKDGTVANHKGVAHPGRPQSWCIGVGEPYYVASEEDLRIVRRPKKEVGADVRYYDLVAISNNPKRKNTIMGKGKLAYIEARIKMLEKELVETLELESRFGSDDDYEVDSVLNYNVKFNGRGITYSFVAIKIKFDMWYTSSQYDKIIDWDTLVEKYLSKAESVYRATAWEEL